MLETKNSISFNSAYEGHFIAHCEVLKIELIEFYMSMNFIIIVRVVLVDVYE